ncbi:MAG: T9SS type A sorting domain-containing protein [Candidatus Cloacimonetes bacterium]|nr:T9SS type A sorting domain-containing protein [Candidatus Cloacimonadota bacterium]
MKRIYLSLMILFVASFLLAETIFVSSERDYSIDVLSSNEMSTIIEYRIGSFNRDLIEINGEDYYKTYLGKEGILLQEGEPELPLLARSIVIPNQAEKEVFIRDAEYVDLEMRVIPSKGLLFRNQDPDSIPYSFSAVYEQNEFYPGSLAELEEPYILRDFRGQTVRVFPFQYNPVNHTLRVYTKLIVEVRTVGSSHVNVKMNPRTTYSREYASIYQNRFINFHHYRYTPLEEQGRMIVICYDAFMDAMQPYVDWKIQKGIRTDIYPVSTIGTTAAAIKNFIQAEYDLDDGLTFLQIVGDAAQVPTFMVGGGGSDPSYSLLEGNDAYGDIFVGRFSAENIAQVQTQVERTIHYERDMTTDDNWLNQAMGVASNEGAGIGHGGLSDIQHLNLIRGWLLGYTYTHVDQIYAPTATAAMVTNAVNAGRGFANYTGHGSNTTWSTTGFSNTHVNALTNDYKLPFIVSVACVNGNFTSTTCFAEAWLRATNNATNNPTGAIAMYASSVNQSWAPPMSGQQEIAQLLVNDQKNTIGGLFFNGSFQMIDDYPSQGPNEFKNWHIFGDASLQVRSDTPQEMQITHLNETFIGLDYFEVDTDSPDLLVAITYEGEILAAGYTESDGSVILNFENPPVEPMELTLTVTGYNKVTYIAPINVIPSDGPYVVIQQVNIMGSGENNAVLYGDQATINVTLRNVGIEIAEEVTATLTNDDPYVTILDDYETFGHIQPDGSVLRTDAYSLLISDAIPDQHRAFFNLEITDDNGNTWNSSFNTLINAPEYDAGSFTIDDSTYGNNNGYLDPSETVVLTIPVQNIGSAISPQTTVTLVSGSPYITIDTESTIDIGVINADDTLYPTFTVTASGDIELGSIFTLGLLITGGEYSFQHSYALNVGPVLEDFETGDFTAHNWQFSGNQPWQIVTDSVYEGTYAAKSGTIGHSQSSTMSLTLDVAAAGNISFYRRVSSENNYDFLRFFINGSMVGQWSGEVAWSQVSYPVSAGTNTFTWTYIKDFIVSAGQDCAWVDFIEFPSAGQIQGGPVFLANPAHIDFEVVVVDDIAIKPFWIRNFGNEEMTGTIETYEGFEIESVMPDIITGSEPSESGRTLYNYAVPPLSNIQFNLFFMPTEAIDYSGEILITSDAENISEYYMNVVANGFILLPPVNLTGEVTNEYIILYWESPEFDLSKRNNGKVDIKEFPTGHRNVEILGYNIYKDDVQINDELVTEEVYHDPDFETYETYHYFVTVVYNLGESSPSNIEEVYVTSVDEDIEYVPYVTELRSNYPNPFNPSTNISFSLQERSHVSIEVYNILGQKVKTLVNQEKEAGIHSVIWDGKNETGGYAASGVYFYRMQTDSYNRTRKMIFMK